MAAKTNLYKLNNKMTLASKKKKKMEEAPEECHGCDECESDEKSKTAVSGLEEGGPVIISLNGPLDEESQSEIIHAFSVLLAIGKPETEVIFTICTPGGDAFGMFAIHDLMLAVRNKGLIIKTQGLGQVMSAGVLLLASGSPGYRNIGRSTQVMMHAMKGASTYGQTHQIEADYKQMVSMNKIYVSNLEKCSKMNEKQINKILDKKSDHYMGAEEAIACGIADNIF